MIIMQTINKNSIGIINKTNYNTVKYANVYRYLCPYIIGHIIPITLKPNNTYEKNTTTTRSLYAGI